MSLLEIVIGTLVVGLAGWALFQSGGERPPRRGCGGSCGPAACGPPEEASDEDTLVTIGRGSQRVERDG